MSTIATCERRMSRAMEKPVPAFSVAGWARSVAINARADSTCCASARRAAVRSEDMKPRDEDGFAFDFGKWFSALRCKMMSTTEASLVEALDLLGITKSASAGDLRAAYLNFAKIHHPDKRASHQAGSLCGAPSADSKRGGDVEDAGEADSKREPLDPADCDECGALGELCVCASMAACASAVSLEASVLRSAAADDDGDDGLPGLNELAPAPTEDFHYQFAGIKSAYQRVQAYMVGCEEDRRYDQAMATMLQTLNGASAAVRGDREVVLAMVQRDGTELRFASEALRADKEVVLEAVRHGKKGDRGGDVLQWADTAMCGERKFITAAAIDCHGGASAVGYASEALRGDRKFILKMIAGFPGGGMSLAHASLALRGDRDVALAAARQDGRSLRFAAESLRADRKLVMAAVQQDPQAMLFALGGLRADAQCAIAAAKLHGGRALDFMDEALRGDIDVVLQVGRAVPSVFDTCTLVPMDVVVAAKEQLAMEAVEALLLDEGGGGGGGGGKKSGKKGGDGGGGGGGGSGKGGGGRGAGKKKKKAKKKKK